MKTLLSMAEKQQRDVNVFYVMFLIRETNVSFTLITLSANDLCNLGHTGNAIEVTVAREY